MLSMGPLLDRHSILVLLNCFGYYPQLEVYGIINLLRIIYQVSKPYSAWPILMYQGSGGGV